MRGFAVWRGPCSRPASPVAWFACKNARLTPLGEVPCPFHSLRLRSLSFCWPRPFSTRRRASAAEKENDARAKRFVEYYEATVRPLEIEAARRFWTANITGKEEDYQKKQEAEEKVDLLLGRSAASLPS